MTSVIAEVVLDPNVKGILDSVHEFYNDAWSSLLTVIAVLFGATVTLFGIVVPWWMERSRRQAFEAEMGRIKKDMRQEYDDKLGGLTRAFDAGLARSQEEAVANLKTTLDDKVKEVQAQLEASTAESRGSIFHMQAIVSLGHKNYKNTFWDCVASMDAYLDAENEADLQRVAKMLVGSIMPKLCKKDLDLMGRAEKELGALLKKMQDTNTRGQYTNHILDMEKGLMLAKQRVKKDSASGDK